MSIGYINAQATTDTSTHATPGGTGWKIELEGVRNDELWESDITIWVKHAPDLIQKQKFERKGKTDEYSLIPLDKILAAVDDADGSTPYRFQQKLWNDGYEVTLTASDGFSAGFLSSDYPINQLFVAIEKNGKAIKPMLIGKLPSQYWIKDLAAINLGLAPVNLASNEFTLEMNLGNERRGYTLKELKNHPYYIEDKGRYTNSHGNTFEHIWGGVKLIDLINDSLKLSDGQTIRIASTDGYEMDYSAEQLLDQNDGVWILAFMEDGEYMPEDPGYIRLVKVGPQNPDITGHISAKMIKSVNIKENEFIDFSITLETPDGIEKMDRQTFQSGVSTHKTQVNYYDRKNSQIIQYMGFPLYELFSRYTYSTVTLTAEDGFAVTLKAEEIIGNKDVIIAMYYGDGSELSDREKPLVLSWDIDASLIPDGIKAIRNINRITINP